MTPARAFYSQEKNIPLWERARANNIENQTGYGFKVKGPNGRTLIGFAIPDEKQLGYGKIVIPLRVPKHDEGLSPNRTFKEEAKVNRGYFFAAQRTSEVLGILGVKPDNPVKGEFGFTSDVREDGHWLLIVERQPHGELPAWRDMTQEKALPKSAAGLMESFNQKFQIGTLEPL